MLYLGIDQHRKQLTVCVRNEEGDVILRRQVSTEWDRVRAFGAEVRNLAGPAGFVVIVEVCGFNDWLLKLLAEYGCRETFVVQPEKQSKKKTDRRDANALCEILWVNRQRLLAGKPVQGVRVVHLPSAQDAADRQLTELRKRMGQLRTRTINKVKHLLRKHNLEQESPTKGLDTVKGKKWLATLALETMDRLEMDLLLDAVEAVGRADRDAGCRDPQASGGKRDGGVAGDDSRLRGLQQPGLGVADRRHRAFPAAGEPGQLLGPDAGLPQLGRGHGSAGLDHQARQRHGAVHPRTVGAARAATRRGDAGLVRPDQEAAGLEDRPGGGDAPVGDDHLAYGETSTALCGGRSTAAEPPGPGGGAVDLRSGSTEGIRPFHLRRRLVPMRFARVRAEATAKAEGAQREPLEKRRRPTWEARSYGCIGPSCWGRSPRLPGQSEVPLGLRLAAERKPD